MLGDQLPGALLNHPALAQDERDGAEIPGPQQVGNEVLEDRDQLAADGPVGLQLQEVEQHRQDIAPQVPRILALDFLVEVLDLLVVEEVEGRVEIIDRDHSLALGRCFFLDLAPDGRGIGAAAFAFTAAATPWDRRALAPLDRHRVLARQLAERVVDELEVLRPQQRQQVVGRVGLEVLCLMQHGEEPDDLEVLDTRLERERAYPVLVQRPRDALVALRLTVDDVVLPPHLCLPDVEDQVVGGLPNLAECAADVIDGALVHGVVRQVQLRSPHPLADDLHQLLDLRGR